MALISTRHWLRSARLILWVEMLGRAAWPVLALGAALLAAALLGLPAAFPGWLHLLLLPAAGIALIFLAVRAAATVRPPGTAEAERRLEQDSGLLHRPFAVLRDRPAGAGDAQRALWHLHRTRAEHALTRLRLRAPRPVLAAADPFALRAAAALLLASGLVVAGPDAGRRLADALLPGLPDLLGGAAPSIQAWVQPPAYTGLPPIFLPPHGGKVPVPSGSRLSVSVSGLHGRPHLTLGGARLAADPLGNDSFEAIAAVTASGRLAVASLFLGLANWDLTVIPNEPPSVAWAALPGRAGTSLATRLPWQVAQRYGVAALQAELRPQNRPDLPALSIPLPLPGTPKKATGTAMPDLSANPYAGLTMTGRLRARDVSGQQSDSEATDFVLPARTFHQPLARAIIDLRRRLALHPEALEEAAADLAALAEAPVGNPPPAGLAAAGITLNLSAAAALLTQDRGHQPGPEAVAAAQDRLWTLALALDGALPDGATRELAEARENLRRGLEDRAHGNLNDRELARRLDALRDALDKRLADIARQAMKQGALQQFDPRSQHLSSNAMDRLMDRLQKAMQEGRIDDARRAMAQLEHMMDQLKNAHIMTQEQARQQQEQAKRGRQMQGAVQDMVQREGTLLDHAQSRARQALPDQPPAGLFDPNFTQQFRGFEFQAPDPSQDEPPQDNSALPDDRTAPPIAQGEHPPGQPPGDAGASRRGFVTHGDRAPDQPPPPPDQAAPEAPSPPSQQQDARIQRALHRALDALSQAFAESGHKPPHNFADAGHAMDDAAQALSRQNDPQARDAVARAIAALQQGAQDMQRQMSEGAGAGLQLTLQPGKSGGQEGEESSDDPEEGQGGRKKDPFGRQVDGNGTVADDPSLRVPDEMEQGRSRAIQQELRKRGADRQRPKGELDYIDRLLKPF
jgi:uncharacterized protein (TIGR02302 family)